MMKVKKMKIQGRRESSKKEGRKKRKQVRKKMKKIPDNKCF